jgi:hypothetical protein
MNTFASPTRRVSNRRIILTLCAFGAGLAASAVSPQPAEAAATVCPARSSGDKPFVMSNIGECVWVNTDHNRTPRLGAVIDYNIYCPGRIPTKGWESVGEKIANGAKIKDSKGNVVSPIAEQHAAADLDVKYIGMPHVFHYGCMGGVATHIKVRVRSAPLGEPAVPNCTQVNQSGSVALNARMDREYKCVGPMFRSSQRGGFDSLVKKVAADLLRGNDVKQAAKAGGKLCMLPATDIQCAPCRHSDKLIVRTKTVPKAHKCPRGSKEIQ